LTVQGTWCPSFPSFVSSDHCSSSYSGFFDFPSLRSTPCRHDLLYVQISIESAFPFLRAWRLPCSFLRRRSLNDALFSPHVTFPPLAARSMSNCSLSVRSFKPKVPWSAAPAFSPAVFFPFSDPPPFCHSLGGTPTQRLAFIFCFPLFSLDSRPTIEIMTHPRPELNL